jgi:hypothetical protein
VSKVIEWVCRNPVVLLGLIVEIVLLVQGHLEEGLSGGELAVALAVGIITLTQRALVTPISTPLVPVDATVRRYVR